MFFENENTEFAGYADDNTPYSYSSTIKNVLANLETALSKLFEWFLKNYLIENAGKCQLELILPFLLLLMDDQSGSL